MSILTGHLECPIENKNAQKPFCSWTLTLKEITPLASTLSFLLPLPSEICQQGWTSTIYISTLSPNQPCSLGYYMYIETSDPRRRGEKAYIISKQRVESMGVQCIRFWYIKDSVWFQSSHCELAFTRRMSEWGVRSRTENVLVCCFCM